MNMIPAFLHESKTKVDPTNFLPLPALNFEGEPVTGKDAITRMTEQTEEEYKQNLENLRRIGLVHNGTMADGSDPRMIPPTIAFTN